MGGLFETSTLSGNLKNIYNKQEIIDYNVYGVTHKCKEAKTNNLVALRIINKKYLERICGIKNIESCLDIIREEIEILKKMSGDYSLNLKEGIEENDSFYIITEIWDTNLEKYLLDRNAGLSIDGIKKIFQKLNIALKRMEENKIIHGNLKLSNILLKTNKSELIPLLSEYGKKATLDEKLNIMQSTSQYSAPELLIGENYDYKVDLWSIGIILYKLYFNEFPFNGETQVAIYNDIKKKKNLKKCEKNYYFNDLIKKLLVTDPNYRMSWEDYFNHKFWELKDNENSSNNMKDNEINENQFIQKIKYKFLFKKKKESSLKKKSYNIFYSLYNKDNQIDNKNLENLKKIVIELENDKDELQMSNLIYQELMKNIQLENLSKLVLYGCKLKNIDILNNIQAVNLLELDLGRNEIENIEPLSTIPYNLLITLNLSHNMIYNISPLVKVSFQNLRNLNLSHNLINDIEPLAQVPFNNLENLKLSSNKIRDIEVFTKVPFSNLTHLDLKNNKISEAAKALAYISINNLVHLDLSHNSIKTLDGLNVGQYKNLISLELGDNDISNIDLLKEVYFSELLRLSLYDNNIERVYTFAKVPFKNLKELNLSYNKIGSIDFVNYMIFLQNLQKLDLNGNKINDLSPLNQISLDALRELELKNNNLKENEENETILNNLKMNYKGLKLLYN